MGLNRLIPTASCRTTRLDSPRPTIRSMTRTVPVARDRATAARIPRRSGRHRARPAVILAAPGSRRPGRTDTGPRSQAMAGLRGRIKAGPRGASPATARPTPALATLVAVAGGAAAPSRPVAASTAGPATRIRPSIPTATVLAAAGQTLAVPAVAGPTVAGPTVAGPTPAVPTAAGATGPRRRRAARPGTPTPIGRAGAATATSSSATAGTGTARPRAETASPAPVDPRSTTTAGPGPASDGRPPARTTGTARSGRSALSGPAG